MPSLLLSCSGELFLSLNCEGCVRYKAKPFLWYKFAGLSADAVSLVLNPYKRCLQVLDELILALGQLACLFL